MKEKIWDKSLGTSLYEKVIGFYGYGDIAKPNKPLGAF